ncbi:MAG TPA: hypothetical protein P5531_10660 [Bacteroidales bacterium]|nr:hypothetical protein [Bacteroidales bacterium]HSA43577.1 hypothetical protein [Bacteroidales bacterium]
MNHTTGRHRRLYGLLKESGTHEWRHDIVHTITQGRTTNSAELSDLEADEMIRYLEQMTKPEKYSQAGVDPQGQQMRRRILSLCYTIGWTRWNERYQRSVVDFERLDAWMMKYGYLHKKLNYYSYKELPTLVTQFESMAEHVLTTKTDE